MLISPSGLITFWGVTWGGVKNIDVWSDILFEWPYKCIWSISASPYQFLLYIWLDSRRYFSFFCQVGDYLWQLGISPFSKKNTFCQDRALSVFLYFFLLLWKNCKILRAAPNYGIPDWQTDRQASLRRNYNFWVQKFPRILDLAETFKAKWLSIKAKLSRYWLKKKAITLLFQIVDEFVQFF